MADSKTSKNLECMIIKKSMETSSPTKEDSDEWSSVESLTSSPYSTGSKFRLCPSCRRRRFESRGETSSEDGEYDNSDSNITYNISGDSSFYMSDTTYSSNGSGYISMDGSSSMDESRTSEDDSNTSSYYCDRSASSSSCSDTEDFVSESASNDTFDCASLSALETWIVLSRAAGYLQNEE